MISCQKRLIESIITESRRVIGRKEICRKAVAQNPMRNNNLFDRLAMLAFYRHHHRQGFGCFEIC